MLNSACSTFRLFGGVWKDLKFNFGRRTSVWVSSKFDLSSLQQFKVHYIWVWEFAFWSWARSLLYSQAAGHFPSINEYFTWFLGKFLSFNIHPLARIRVWQTTQSSPENAMFEIQQLLGIICQSVKMMLKLKLTLKSEAKINKLSSKGRIMYKWILR